MSQEQRNQNITENNSCLNNHKKRPVNTITFVTYVAKFWKCMFMKNGKNP